MRLARRSAFSMVEVLISIAVLSVGSLGVMSALMFGTRAASHAQSVTEANNYARQIIELIRMRNAAGTMPSDLSPVALDAFPFSGTLGVMPSGTRYTRQITLTPVSGYTNFSEIRVRIFWPSYGAEGTGVKQRSVELRALHGN